MSTLAMAFGVTIGVGHAVSLWRGVRHRSTRWHTIRLAAISTALVVTSLVGEPVGAILGWAIGFVAAAMLTAGRISQWK